MTAIETFGLTKRFGDIVAVSDLNLTIESGEIFGFLGPNGAGKSTTINVLLDFVRPSSGRATVLGMDAQDDSEAIRDRVGVLPEGASVYNRLSGREHIQWVVDVKGAQGDPDTYLERVGLTDDGDRAAGEYSKGMRQRLGLGMALVGDPDLLILDEPSTGLDPNGIQHMREILKDEAADGTSVFFSSHILAEVEAVCDRVGIMNAGELVVEDSLENLRDAGGRATIEFELQESVDSLSHDDIESISGVRRVALEDGHITAIVDDTTVKVDVITHLGAQATVTDIRIEDTSLEELFNRYTDVADPGEAGEVEDPEVVA